MSNNQKNDQQDQIKKHFLRWAKRGCVEEMKIDSIKLHDWGIKIIIEIKAEEFSVIPPKGYQIIECTMINLQKVKLEISIEKLKGE